MLITELHLLFSKKQQSYNGKVKKHSVNKTHLK